MKFILKNAKLTFLALIICFSFSACDDEDDFRPGDQVTTPNPDPDPDPDPDDGTTESNTIIDFLSADDNYSSLVAAIEAAELTATLDGDTEYTLFAPDNDAFDAFLSDNGYASLEEVNTDTLKVILMNHVQSGTLMAADLSTGYVESMAEGGPDGENLSLYIDTSDGVTLNNTSTVSSADNEVDNGVVHGVDAVIGLPDVTTFATADSEFSVLAQALTDEELVATLQSTESPAPFTIFAPTDEAFEALLTELEIGGLEELDASTLTATLQYHVVTDDNITSDELTDGITVTTLQGEDITVGVGDDVTLVDVNERMATVITADIQATNGVIHKIDMVLLPTLE